MSKKYKLIKEYPNSPKLGSVIIDTNTNNGAKDCWFSEDWGKSGSKAFFIPRSTNPEKHPEFWELVKEKPLFITEDKVEIFNGDNYWFVVKSDLEIVKAWIPRLHICDWDYSGEHKKPPLGHVQFSTEKAAKDWIHLNKPQYSMQDIFNAKSDESKFPNHFGIDFSKLKPFNI